MSYGAILGDLVGSVYEWDRIKTKEFEFFKPDCFYTDDTVCTAAVAHILLDGPPSAAQALRQWCRKHPGRGYGGIFSIWIDIDEMDAYGSYGNGAAMRVSPAAFLNRHQSIEEALVAADRVTSVTHNHPEGIKGARATTHAIWLAFQKHGPEHIRKTIELEYGYDLSRTVDEIRPDYDFDETCQGTVPQAITCALESTSFEDAVRNAISLGGDSDTLAAIAGPIAEALHGVPKDLVERARQYLPTDIIGVVERLYSS
ncbi:MAG: ADP-ribosylglycohydrolase family protein [Rhodothermaceae bacterium]|nr:ADP-ribosylglycohydrolase family protein [Rhodothermaceae bacterium]MXZ57343.1 ADP-ribosylglycohydrolase family protein [Rhodothermaceae bacterium]MYB90618.1 ADP-ribosylglycohydrolase family protein [Rhodothermaceae bacterium]MYD68366.1 ADP-ribosylglycohydrolase family protein [Rhodothermaceae bacterium]MYG44355.1 ADP-ribosylglycohydrolase family protein [Rhodothermaceae bacterium]